MQADDLRKALEAMGIPCFLGGMTRGGSNTLRPSVLLGTLTSYIAMS